MYSFFITLICVDRFPIQNNFKYSDVLLLLLFNKLWTQIIWGVASYNRNRWRKLTLFPCPSTGSDLSTFPAFCGPLGIEGWFMPPDKGLEGLVFLARLLGALWSCGVSSVVRVMVGGGVSLTCCCSDIADTALGGSGSRPITEPDPEAARHKIRPFKLNIS